MTHIAHNISLHRKETVQQAETSQQFVKWPSSHYSKEKLELHDSFFDRLISEMNLKKVDADIIAILHILPDALPFTRALSKIAKLRTIIPKPKSINDTSLKSLNNFDIRYLNRGTIMSAITDIHRKTVLLDIGGYFAPHINELQEKLKSNFAGIVEDTENGFRKYESQGLNFPFINVSRSPLKENEDVIVGQAIAYSAEVLLRQRNLLFNGLKVGIIGFGKIGRSIASNIRQKKGRVTIYDRNNIHLTHAISKGFEISCRDQIISESDVLCLATGNYSLTKDDFERVKNGVWIFSVTSSDDEFDKTWLDQNYHKEKIAEHVEKYTKSRKYFYLLNEGNAINFIYGTTIGDFILLVHAELLVAAYKLLTNSIKSKEKELNRTTRDKICEVWLSIFRQKQ